jgi:hypothetical protein
MPAAKKRQSDQSPEGAETALLISPRRRITSVLPIPRRTCKVFEKQHASVSARRVEILGLVVCEARGFAITVR